MPKLARSNQNPTISGDELFMESFPVHPMVAVFIALPINNDPQNMEIRLKKARANLHVTATSVPKKDGKWVLGGLPCGMAARRILLYIFAEAYQTGNTSLAFGNGSRQDILYKLGYRQASSLQGNHPLFRQLVRIQRIAIKFENPKDNEQCGFSLKNYSDNMLGVRRDNDGEIIEGPFLNPNFLFNMAFPVDFNHVIGTDKKNRFWNVYMFLIDVLPRIEKGKVKEISWSLVHDVFYHRPANLAHFKFYFKKEVEDVINIYPKADGKVIMNDKTYLKLKHAPPPI